MKNKVDMINQIDSYFDSPNTEVDDLAKSILSMLYAIVPLNASVAEVRAENLIATETLAQAFEMVTRWFLETADAPDHYVLEIAMASLDSYRSTGMRMRAAAAIKEMGLEDDE